MKTMKHIIKHPVFIAIVVIAIMTVYKKWDQLFPLDNIEVFYQTLRQKGFTIVIGSSGKLIIFYNEQHSPDDQHWENISIITKLANEAGLNLLLALEGIGEREDLKKVHYAARLGCYAINIDSRDLTLFQQKEEYKIGRREKNSSIAMDLLDSLFSEPVLNPSKKDKKKFLDQLTKLIPSEDFVDYIAYDRELDSKFDDDIDLCISKFQNNEYKSLGKGNVQNFDVLLIKCGASHGLYQHLMHGYSYIRAWGDDMEKTVWRTARTKCYMK